MEEHDDASSQHYQPKMQHLTRMRCYEGGVSNETGLCSKCLNTRTLVHGHDFVVLADHNVLDNKRDRMYILEAESRLRSTRVAAWVFITSQVHDTWNGS